jgi:hypothetical protein
VRRNWAQVQGTGKQITQNNFPNHMHSHCRTPWRTRHWWKGSGQLITEIRAAGDRAEILSAEFVDQQDAQRFGVLIKKPRGRVS